MTPEERSQYTFSPSNSYFPPTTTPPTSTRRSSVASITTQNQPYITRQTSSELRLQTLSKSFERALQKQAKLEEQSRLDAILAAEEAEREFERRRPIPVGWRTLGVGERIVKAEDEIGPGDIVVGRAEAVRYWEPERAEIAPAVGGGGSGSGEGVRTAADAMAAAAAVGGETGSSSSASSSSPSTASRTASASSDETFKSVLTSATTPRSEKELEELCGSFERLKLDVGAGREGEREREDMEAAARGLRRVLERVQRGQRGEGKGREEGDDVWKLWEGVARAALVALEGGR